MQSGRSIGIGHGLQVGSGEWTFEGLGRPVGEGREGLRRLSR